MKRGLFRNLLIVTCAIASASVGLAVVIQDRTLTADLEQAADERLDRAAASARRLVDYHLESTRERYRAVASTPQFRATLEIDDRPTLQFYAESLLEQHAAARILFVRDAENDDYVGAGDARLDAGALGVDRYRAIVSEGGLYAVSSVPIGRFGRLVGVTPIDASLLDEWSELCGATVSLDLSATTSADAEREVLALGDATLEVRSSFERERQAIARARSNMAVGAMLGILLAFGASLLVSRNLVRPILQLERAARRIGGGDLTRQEHESREDELGRAARAFADMTSKLREAIVSTVRAADRVDETARRITDECTRLRDAAQAQQVEAEETSGVLEEVQERLLETAADAMESGERIQDCLGGSTASFRELTELGETLRDAAVALRSEVAASAEAMGAIADRAHAIAENTEAVLPSVATTHKGMTTLVSSARSVDEHVEETARLSNLVADRAEEGRTRMRAALQGMRATQETIRTSEERIHALGERINEIGLILTVIEGVNDETSLLALNGSIVAARAGEHGKAFSIVSDQLRDLARRVRNSASEIHEIVGAVTHERDLAITAIAAGTADMADGVDAIERVAQSLEAIVESAHESHGRMIESSGFTRRQRALAADAQTSLEAVREGVARIREATRDQVDLTASMASNAERLGGLAEDVTRAVERQAAGVARIGGSFDQVHSIVERVTRGLRAQVDASQSVADQVRKTIARNAAYESATVAVDEAADLLSREAAALHGSVACFEIGELDGRDERREREEGIG